jgi:hypothetical protein
MRGELQQVGRHWIYYTMVYIGAAHGMPDCRKCLGITLHRRSQRFRPDENGVRHRA